MDDIGELLKANFALEVLFDIIEGFPDFFLMCHVQHLTDPIIRPL